MSKILKYILNFFFPSECLECGKEDYFICPSCVRTIPQNIKTLKIDNLKIYTLSTWKSALVQKAIKQLKFKYAKDVIYDLEPFIKKAINEISFPKNAIFVPVPLHAIRKNKRGFNQSELLSNAFGKLPTNNTLLKRYKNTYPQSLTEPKKRKENICDAFCINKNLSSKNISIFLVDDVVMSGSTLLECAKTLKKAGYKDISAVVFAKSRKNNLAK
jgi:ComF family protein